MAALEKEKQNEKPNEKPNEKKVDNRPRKFKELDEELKQRMISFGTYNLIKDLNDEIAEMSYLTRKEQRDMRGAALTEARIANNNDPPLKEQLTKILEEMKKIKEQVANVSLRQQSPWDAISTQTPLEKRDAMRDVLKKAYNMKIARCMISGIVEKYDRDENNYKHYYNTGGLLKNNKFYHNNEESPRIPIKLAGTDGAKRVLKYKVVGAHLIPYSQIATFESALNKGYVEKFAGNGARNGLLLCNFLEQAFDERRFTLIPENALYGIKSLKVFVLDPNDKELQPFDGHGVEFPHGVDIRPYNRVIAWHCKDAFDYAYFTQGWIDNATYEQYKTMKDISQRAESEHTNDQ